MQIRCTIALASLLALTASAGPPPAASRPTNPDDALAQIDAIGHPTIDRSRASDPAYLEAFKKQADAAWARQGELELAF